MSQAEFDSYLSLMAKFLRLRSRQRDALADELRDHLESRLDELLAQGKTREQAVKIALEEFGDAAVLAEDFSRLASRHTRRFVMRCTAASAVVVAAVVLLTLSLAPPLPDGPGPQNVVAQEEIETPQPPDVAAPAIPDGPSVEQEAVAVLDKKLGKPLTDVAFVEMPLENVLGVIADQIEADVLVDKAGLEDEGVADDTPVSLSLTRTPVTARTVLEFVLEPNGLTVVNRAGVIYVTTMTRADELLTTRVYNVRDLLENAKSHTTVPPATGMEEMGGGMGGGGFYSIPTTALLAGSVGQLGSRAGEGGAEGMMMEGGMDGFGMESGGMGMSASSRLVGPANELISTIQQTTGGPWLEKDGTGGTLTVFNGLLVVRQTDEVHTEIQKLLDALREAAEQQPGSSVTVPKEGKTPPAEAPLLGESPAADRPASREEFAERLKKYGLDENAANAVTESFRNSGGSRTLCPITLLSYSMDFGEGPLHDAVKSLNVEPMRLTQFNNVVVPDPCPESPYPLLEKADKLAGDGPIGTQHLVLALLQEFPEPMNQALQSVGLTTAELQTRLSKGSGTSPKPDVPVEGADESTSSRASDLSWLSDYSVTPDARHALLTVVEEAGGGSITELEALRGLTLTHLPNLEHDFHQETINRIGISRRAWSQAIGAASAQDRPLGELKTLLDAAARISKDAGADSIDVTHLLVALLEREEGPIPTAYADVGLTPQVVRKKFLQGTGQKDETPDGSDDFRRSTPPQVEDDDSGSGVSGLPRPDSGSAPPEAIER
ncbi:MAG: permease prefix domain 1-containing protein [Planctomycetaceae bacterium]